MIVVVCCLLFVRFPCSLFVWCLLLVVVCSLLVVCCLLMVVCCCLLFVHCCLLCVKLRWVILFV